MPDFDATIVGAGAVGLACAAALAEAGQSVLILEAEALPGSHTSARNSEVIHAGLYYPTGSLKHRLSVRGRRLLYPFLAAHGVAHRKCGKLVTATSPAELPAIEAIAARAAANGVENIRLLTAAEARAREPEVQSHGALLSAETGIFDSHGYMAALIARIEAQGGLLACRSPLASAEPTPDGFNLTTGGDDPAHLTTARLVNSAGLFAQATAGRIAGLALDHIPPLHLARGCYFGLTGKSPFQGLVYPAPVEGGLGIHATIDLAGRTRFGPDVEWLPPGAAASPPDYSVDPARAGAFATAIRRYWPGLPEGALYPDYAGIRPKLAPRGSPDADFRIDGPEVHGVEGLVNLFGIESPGLTASLAIAEEVAARLA